MIFTVTGTTKSDPKCEPYLLHLFWDEPLIKFNYDNYSRKGGRFMVNREGFFKSLYIHENLKAAQFEFLPQSEDLLSSPEYVNAKRYYSREAFLKEGTGGDGAGVL